MFGIPYVRQDWIDREIDQAASWDPFGHRLQVFFGLFWCVLVAGPTSWVEWAGVGLATITLTRFYYIHRTWRSVGCHPQIWAIALWAAWQWYSTTYSPNPRFGLLELSSSRWTWSLWFLWTILPRRSWLLTALILGFFAANISQLIHGIGVHFHIPSLQFPRMPDRNAGWWQPVVGGSMLCAALGLHLPAAAMGSGRQRLLGLAGSTITLIGIFATGTRGAWIGATGLVALILCIAAIRWFNRRRGESRSGLRIALLLGALIVSLGLTWLIAGDSMTRRYRLGRDEVARALNSSDYGSDTGARILMWKWAIEEIKAHPIRGVGAGGYDAWAVQEMHKRGEDKYAGHLHHHAHSTYLHIAATTGLVGLFLWGLMIALSIRGAFKGLGDRIGTYAAGPGFAIVGLLFAGVFDVVQLNTQTTALLSVLMGLSIYPRPHEWVNRPRGPWGRPFPRHVPYTPSPSAHTS